MVKEAPPPQEILHQMCENNNPPTIPPSLELFNILLKMFSLLPTAASFYRDKKSPTQNPYESIKTTKTLIRTDRLDGQRNQDAKLTFLNG